MTLNLQPGPRWRKFRTELEFIALANLFRESTPSIDFPHCAKQKLLQPLEKVYDALMSNGLDVVPNYLKMRDLCSADGLRPLGQVL